jgi:DNA-binding transcriptional LysR family regulator
MRSLNPDHLRALTEVVAHGSFTRAAKRLNLAQPTVSLQIRELETRLGVRLVDRLGKRAFATAAGRELIEHATRLAQETERLLAAMRRHRDGWLGQVRIGSSTTALIYHLPPVLARLRKEHPNIELVVTTGTTTGVSISTLPSAGAFFIDSATMRPPAPGRFSTSTGCFSSSFMRSAIRRAAISAEPPGAKPTTILTGLSTCAWAAKARPAKHSAVPILFNVCMGLLR